MNKKVQMLTYFFAQVKHYTMFRNNYKEHCKLCFVPKHAFDFLNSFPTLIDIYKACWKNSFTIVTEVFLIINELDIY